MAVDTSVLVAVPTRGERPEMLRAALASVRAQEWPHSVVVVAPRPSTELSRTCDEWGATLLEQRGTGMTTAIAEAWDVRATPFVAWLGDDDRLLRGSLARAAQALVEQPAATASYGMCRWVDASGEPLFVMRPGRYARWTAAFGPNFLPQPGSVFRRASVEAVGGLDASLRYAMDLDLFLRLQRTGPLVYVPHLLADFRQHAGSTTTMDLQASWDEARVVQRRVARARRWWSVKAKVAWAALPVAERLLVDRDVSA